MRGVYRLVHFPSSELEDLVALWLLSNREGVFSHETALALHQLSDSMPSKIHMTLPISWKERRVRYPGSIVPSFSVVGEADRAWVGPIPGTLPLRTITDCRAAHVEPDLIAQAIAEAVERGIFRAEALKLG